MKIKYILLAATILFSACKKDFLDSKPKAKLSDELLNTPEGIEGLCVAAYAALAGPDGQGTHERPTTNWIYGDVRAETAYKGGGGVGDLSEFNAFETFTGVFATFGVLDGKWFDLYRSVQRANSAIKRLNAVSEADMPLKNVRLGEMRFLRAHYFFELNRLFNRIPYFDENVETTDYIKISNTALTRDQLLEKIAAEFAAASDLLPVTQPEAGRVTKYAAKAYQSKVVLYRAYKQNDNNTFNSIDLTLMNEALLLSDEVINKGGYALLDDFQKLSQAEFDNSRESVFAVQYSVADGTTNGRINWSNLLNAPRGPAYGGDGFFQPSQNLVNSYKTDVNGIPMPEAYNNADLMTVADGLANNVDPRLDFTVGRIGVRWKNYTASAYAANWAREPATYGYYHNKKALVSPESPFMVKGFPWGGSALNWTIIRYADVLLWKAEALIELNRENEAIPLINEVRMRAKNSRYVLAFPNTSATDYAAKYKIETYQPGVNCVWTNDYARKALRFERKLEFAMEGERFFDLVRWGNAEQVLNQEYFPKEKQLRTYLQNARFVKGRDEYFPIPQAQINFSGGLYTQNPNFN